ncbi:bifunctional DNA primase/polymerase [Streptomyces endophytica]|uniref:bifunctional DNA primase/polymerase n=1 Tax=Streptomyces endophytica TaxID=2991496 RepID=UPI003C6ED222
MPALRSPHRGHPEVPPCHGGCGRLGHGVHDASTDPFTIRRMFAAAPWATGYGIACGLPPHHLIGLDLDIKNGADGLTALLLLAEAHDFPVPPTIMVRTPSGGRHVWFTGPPSPPVPNSVGRLAPGIDVRGAAAIWSAPAHSPPTAATSSPRTPRPAPLPSPAPCSRCSRTRSWAPSRTPARPPGAPPRSTPLPDTSPRPASRPSPPRRSYASCVPPRSASATPGSSGPPAAPTRTASARSSPPA